MSGGGGEKGAWGQEHRRHDRSGATTTAGGWGFAARVAQTVTTLGGFDEAGGAS